MLKPSAATLAALDSPCIEYSGARHVEHGYGIMRFKGVTQRAHRVAYCQANGIELAAISGMTVRHRCDNPPCVNPAHLVLGTHTDNMRDMIARGRNRQPKGSGNGRSKLTESIVSDVKRRLAEREPLRAIARSVGVASSTIARISTGQIWRHVCL